MGIYYPLFQNAHKSDSGAIIPVVSPSADKTINIPYCERFIPTPS